MEPAEEPTARRGAADGTAAAPASPPRARLPHGKRLIVFLVALGWGALLVSNMHATGALGASAAGGYQAAYRRLIQQLAKGGGWANGTAGDGSSGSGPGRPAAAAAAADVAAGLRGGGASPRDGSGDTGSNDDAAEHLLADSRSISHFKLLPVAEAGESSLGPRAIITMVAGNVAARHAVVLLQSLIDVGTRVPVIVMLQQGGLGSPECQDKPWKAAHNRSHVHCAGPDTIPEEIISPFYLKILRRLGAHLMVTPEIPRTRWTVDIIGGTQTFWGMSLNRCVLAGVSGGRRPMAVVPELTTDARPHSRPPIPAACNFSSSRSSRSCCGLTATQWCSRCAQTDGRVPLAPQTDGCCCSRLDLPLSTPAQPCPIRCLPLLCPAVAISEH
jgi:hypothetical protein